MIATNDIKTILYNEAKRIGIALVDKDEHEPVTEFEVPERVVVVVNASGNEDWQNTFARILVYVPKIYISDNKTYKSNTSRLGELERFCNSIWSRKTFTELDGETIYFKIEDIIQENDPETWSDFLNIRLRITNTNFKL